MAGMFTWIGVFLETGIVLNVGRSKSMTYLIPWLKKWK